MLHSYILPADLIDDDEALTDIEARDQAECELLANPWAVLCQLQMHIDDSDTDPLPDALPANAAWIDPTDCTVQQLLMLALHDSPFGRELMKRFEADLEDDIAGRAAELMAQGVPA